MQVFFFSFKPHLYFLYHDGAAPRFVVTATKVEVISNDRLEPGLH